MKFRKDELELPPVNIEEGEYNAILTEETEKINGF